ncbi:CCA tRNA nucleotidyltransferase [Candidatus Parcubacteria bacterium]|nr:CCA tRNA nucleotidyltransferase [Candidatus Parcubacteria bacterium]
MKIPIYVQNIITELEKAGYEAYIVGGCVRDLLMNKQPKDWDVTTNAKPEEILRIFPDGRYENVFGTVIVPMVQKTENKKHQPEAGPPQAEKAEIMNVEITTYRSEQGYSDRRHPDEIVFEKELDKDLSRRDFTINALALKSIKSQIPISKQISNFKSQILNYYIIDLFGGQKDIKKKIIRAVGEPVDRFKEDALRMMRAIRLACELGFAIEPKTERAIKKMAGNIKFIAKERIRDELVKILRSDRSYNGIMWLHNLKLLQYIIPELERGIGVSQCKHHIYSVFKHSVLSLKHCPSKDWRVRLAALMHDIAKPQTKKFIGGDATFYNHDIVGAKITKKIMRRLRFANEDIDKVTTLIRNHMFYYNVGDVTASSVRRLVKKVGEENLKDLIDLRIADRLGSGVPKAKPYKLRHLEYMMKKVRKDPLSVKMLKINGDELMELLKIKPGVKIGAILDVLLSEVVEEPKLNNKKYLEKRSCELNALDLKELRAKAREKIDERKMEDDKELKKEFWVK